MSLRVTQLAIYPVKSLRAVPLQAMTFDRRGPAWDRRFIVCDGSGEFLSQRQHPRMCLVDVVMHDTEFVLSAPAMPVLHLEPIHAGAHTQVTVWGDRVTALDMGDTAAQWFSRYLGVDARLHFMPDDSIRPVDPTYGRAGDTASFVDGFPVLLITEASLHAFNASLPQPIGAERFRPNIVIDGDLPYAEDGWRRLRIGAIEFDIVKPCSRCVIPSIDPLTAEKQSYVVQALAKTRRRGDAVYFGQNLIHRGVGTIAVGDALAVIS